MRVLLVGCGGIGGIVAATLSRAGVEVAVVTGNAEIRAALLQHGARVRDLDGTVWSARPKLPIVVEARELLGTPGQPLVPYDLCLLGTKTTTLETALRDVQPLLGENGSVVCLQNGLPEERAAAVLGADRVIGCVVGWGATLIEPGLSARSSTGGFQLGRVPPGKSDARLAEAAAVLGRGFDARIAADFAGVRWSKLAINCATSTLGAAGGDTLGRLLRYRFVRRLALEIWSEVAAVARASKVRMAKVAGTLDIERLSISERERNLRLGSPGLFLKHAVLWGLALKFRRMRSSMAIAIERGRRPEIDWLNGEVVRRGAALGIATPVNGALVALIHDIVAKKQRPGVDTLYGVYRRTCTGARALPTTTSGPAVPAGLLAPDSARTDADAQPRG